MSEGTSLSKIEPRCSICMAEENIKQMVDRMAAHGFRPIAISRQIQSMDDTFFHKKEETVRKAVERHIQRHLSFEAEAVRRIVEENARKAGILTDEYTATLVTGGAILDRIIQKGWKQLTDEDSRVPIEWVLKAVEQKDKRDADGAASQVDLLTKQLASIIQAIQETIPEELFQVLINRAREINETPILDAHVTLEIEEASEEEL